MFEVSDSGDDGVMAALLARALFTATSLALLSFIFLLVLQRFLSAMSATLSLLVLLISPDKTP